MVRKVGQGRKGFSCTKPACHYVTELQPAAQEEWPARGLGQADRVQNPPCQLGMPLSEAQLPHW